MSEVDTKELIINIKDLIFLKEQYVEDLLRFLEEQLPQIEISRNGNELEIVMPLKLSKKFLYRKNLNEKYRPISYNTNNQSGYMIKEKKVIELAYY